MFLAVSKKYFAWKYADCNGVNPEWIEIDSNEYYRLVTQTQRHFAKITDGSEDGDPILVLETTEEKSKEFDRVQHKNQRHNQAQQATGYKTVSFESMNEEELGYDDVIADESKDTALEAEKEILSEELNNIISAIGSNEERKLLDALFYNNPNGLSERRIAEKMALSQSTFRRKTAKIVKKIKKSLNNADF